MEKLEWAWDVSVESWKGRKVKLETKDGIAREGRISQVTMEHIRIGEEVVALPRAVELNGEPGDEVEFTRLKGLDFV